jgi:gamma-glutamyltranspeptidase/glutathione hydrolase
VAQVGEDGSKDQPRDAMPGVAQPKEYSGVFPNAAVAADHVIASNAGLEMLRAGGNAVDAAVASSFTLSVVRPYSCGIGGGGFMVIRLQGDPKRGDVTTAINYRETAPGAAREDYYEKDADPDSATHGGKAVAVPGHVAGMLYALEKYGTLERQAVLAPAIRAAEEGFLADAHYVKSNDEVIEWLTKKPGRVETYSFVWERYLHRGKVKVGDRIHVPEQARVLRLIAEKGLEGFYAGDVAEAMVRAASATGGEMTLADLRGYTVKEVEPFRTRFRGYEVLTMPPPSSGGIVLAQVFGMLEARSQMLESIVFGSGGGYQSVAYVHLLTEASKHAFADRARWLGDPDFVEVPIKGLLSAAYIKSKAEQIDPSTPLATEAYGTVAPPPDDGGTSHLCVIDEHGGAVSCTETINLIFGSLVVVPEYGFALNNEMDDFQARLEKANAFGLLHATKNRPAPGKRPLSSMTPIIALQRARGEEAERVALIAGGSGGPRIISGTLQVALNALYMGMNAKEAVEQPRFHHQWMPDTLQMEDGLFNNEREHLLGKMGHVVERRDAVGNVQVITRGAGGWHAASDPRKGGAPAGY